MKILLERLEDRVLLSRTLVDGPVLDVWADPHDTIAVVRANVVAGDTNLDGQVDIDDYLAMDASAGMGTGNPGWAGGDFNGDGVVNAADYAMMAAGGLVSGWEVITNGVPAFFGSQAIKQVSTVAVGVGNVSLSGSQSNISYWVDAAATVSAGSGVVHTIGSFYQPWTNVVGSPDYVPMTLNGQNLRDPSDTAQVNYNGPLWGQSPSMSDVAQGPLGDCYWLAGLNAMVENSPQVLFSREVNFGDGTFGVDLKSVSADVVVRVDGDFSSGASQFKGALWDLVAEKAFAFVRNGGNSYASISIGYVSEPFNSFGLANGYHAVYNQFAFFQSAAATGTSVAFGTNSAIVNGANLIGAHAYTLVAAFVQNGVQYVTLQNPWGVDGVRTTDSNFYDGEVTVTMADLAANCPYAVSVTALPAGIGSGSVGGADLATVVAPIRRVLAIRLQMFVRVRAVDHPLRDL